MFLVWQNMKQMHFKADINSLREKNYLLAHKNMFDGDPLNLNNPPDGGSVSDLAQTYFWPFSTVLVGASLKLNKSSFQNRCDKVLMYLPVYLISGHKEAARV